MLKKFQSDKIKIYNAYYSLQAYNYIQKEQLPEDRFNDDGSFFIGKLEFNPIIDSKNPSEKLFIRKVSEQLMVKFIYDRFK